MQKSLVAVAVIVSSLATAAMSPRQAESLEERFRLLETRWMDALASKDAKTLESLLAREFTIMGLGSTLEDPTTTRREWLDVGLKRPFPKHQVKIIDVTDAGDTAVVQCILTADYPPMPWIPEGGTLRVLVTDTWILRDGRWQVLARHASRPAEERKGGQAP